MASIRATRGHIGRKVEEVLRVYEEIRNFNVPEELKRNGGFRHELWAEASTNVTIMIERMKLKCQKVYDQIGRTENLISMLRDDKQIEETRALDEYCQRVGTNRIGDYLNDATELIKLLNRELEGSRIREIHARLRQLDIEENPERTEMIRRSARPAPRVFEGQYERRLIQSGGETPILQGSPIWLRNVLERPVIPVANLLDLEEEVNGCQSPVDTRNTPTQNQWAYPVDNHFVYQENGQRTERRDGSQDIEAFNNNNDIFSVDGSQDSSNTGISRHVVNVPLRNGWGTNQQATTAENNLSPGPVIRSERGRPSEPRRQAMPNNRQHAEEQVNRNQRSEYMSNVNHTLQHSGFQKNQANRQDHAQVQAFPAERSRPTLPQQPLYGDQDVRSHQVRGGMYSRPPTQMEQKRPFPPAPPTPGRYDDVPQVNQASSDYGMGNQNPYQRFSDPFGTNVFGTSNPVPPQANRNGGEQKRTSEEPKQSAPRPSDPLPEAADTKDPNSPKKATNDPDAKTSSNTGTSSTTSKPSATTTTTAVTANTGMDALAQFIDNRSRTPIMPLTSFDGCATKWKKWWAIFSYAVHNNVTMDKTQKMLHLVSNVSGEAALIIEPAEADEEKYDLCIASLKKRYERPQDTRRCLVERLQAIPRCTKDVKEIRDTYTRVKSGFDCLNSLEDNETNTLMLELVKQKFPENIQTKIGKWVHELGTNWTMSKMLEKMENFVIAEEAGKPKTNPAVSSITTLPAILPQANYQHRPARSTSRNYNGTSRERSESRARTTYNFRRETERPGKVDETLANKGCGICEKEGHHAVKCRSVMDPVERRRAVNKNRLCYGCLSANHMAKDCDASNCFKCNGKHHSSLCTGGKRDPSHGRYSKSPARELRGEERLSNYRKEGTSFQSAPRTTTPS